MNCPICEELACIAPDVSEIAWGPVMNVHSIETIQSALAEQERDNRQRLMRHKLRLIKGRKDQRKEGFSGVK